MDVIKNGKQFTIKGSENEIITLLMDAEFTIKNFLEQANEKHMNDKSLAGLFDEYKDRSVEYERSIYQMQLLRGIDPNEL